MYPWNGLFCGWIGIPLPQSSDHHHHLVVSIQPRNHDAFINRSVIIAFLFHITNQTTLYRELSNLLISFLILQSDQVVHFVIMTTLLKNSLQFILALVLSRANRTLASNQDDPSSYEFCIVGAGAAGIQLSRFLQLANRNFIVLERHDQAGSFFTKYPKQEGLISINKKYTGHSDPEFNLRHDWNSLLTGDDGNSGTELKFTDLTDEYWPHRSYLVEYLNLFVEKYELRSYIQYQTNVDTVQKKGSEFYIEATQTDKESNHTNVRKYTCEKLIWATGFSKPRTFKSNPHGWNIVPYHEMGPASEYKNKTVTILGAGQSAFEAARALYKVTADTQIVYRTPPKFAYLTHYPGDIRVMNQEILDSYQLKSLGKW